MKGLVSHLFPTGIVVLQYVDDTILCLEKDTENARNMKLLLYLYELMSGLKINFQKSEIVFFGEDESQVLPYAVVPFDCQIGYLPLKYLGVSVGSSSTRLHVCGWQKLEDKILILRQLQEMAKRQGRGDLLRLPDAAPSMP